MVEQSEIGSILNYEDLKAKFRSHFSQQKKFTKTYLAVHNIKQREGESTRAFITRYTDDTLQILGLHKEQRISGLSWARHESVLRIKTSSRGGSEIRTAGSLGKRSKKKEKISDTQLGKWKKGEKDTTPVEAPIIMIRRESYNPRKRPAERNNSEVREITFPPLRNISSADPVIIKAYLETSIRSLQVDSVIPLVGFSGEKFWPLGEVPLEITIREGPLKTTKTLNFFIVGSDSPHNIILGRISMQQIRIVVSIIHRDIKFYTPQGIGTVLSQYNLREPKEEQRATSEEHQEEVKGILSCVDTGERIVVNDQYPEQTISIGRQLPTKTKIRLQDLLRTYVDVFAWTTTHMTGVLRTVTIGGEAFNTEHKINKLKHLEPVK
ncbi:hypothetical protein Tco_0766046 [Tanacetum coccineum]